MLAKTAAGSALVVNWQSVYGKYYLSGPGMAKKRKDFKQNSGLDMGTGDEKSVINELCFCKDTCTTCTLREINSSSTTAESGKPTECCQCLCNQSAASGSRYKLLKLESLEKGNNGLGVFTSALLESESQNSQDSTNERDRDKVQVLDNKMSVSSGVSALSSAVSTAERDNFHTLEKMSVSSGVLAVSSAVSTPVSVSAIVDGENAMFPDLMDNTLTPGKNSVEKSELGSPCSCRSDTYDNIDPETLRNDMEKTPRRSRLAGNSSQMEMEKVFRNMLDVGWGPDDVSDLTIAELYLMFGGNGELKFEYEWVNIKKETERLQEKLLMSLNNMLRRLSHLATMEITEFSKVCLPSLSCEYFTVITITLLKQNAILTSSVVAS